MFYIHPTECIECGMCESICPVDAIRYDDELDAENAVFARINREVFLNDAGDFDEPGGWSKKMSPRPDHVELTRYTQTKFALREC